jgi:hypothetical protein
MLRRRTFRVPPFEEKRYGDSDENELPNRNCVQVDHSHSCEQKSDASDQKYWASDDAVERPIPRPVCEATDGHREQTCSRWRRMEWTPKDTDDA